MNSHQNNENGKWRENRNRNENGKWEWNWKTGEPGNEMKSGK